MGRQVSRSREFAYTKLEKYTYNILKPADTRF